MILFWASVYITLHCLVWAAVMAFTRKRLSLFECILLMVSFSMISCSTAIRKYEEGVTAPAQKGGDDNE